MRLLSAFFLALIMAAVAGTTRADKLDPNEKDWSYRPFVPTSVLPEQEPNGVCPGQAMACGDEIQPAALDPAGDLDWFSFYVDETFRCVTIGTDSYQGSSTDTYLELYDACDGSILAYDDDGGPGLFSLISQFIAPHPGTYYVKVRGYSQTTVGAYTLFLWCTDLPLPPPNDRCEGAYPIERCTAGTLDGTLSNYTNDYDPWGGPQPSCTGWTARGRDATYQLDLQMADICHFVYTQYVDDASFYIVTDCDNVNQSCVIGADATVTGEPETIDWTCPAPGTYFLILDAYGTDAGGEWTLSYEITCPAPARVCCLGHLCQLVPESECAAMQGQWHPEWDSCGPPNPCDVYTPAERSSWGELKVRYR
jgi:hypothetical protein